LWFAAGVSRVFERLNRWFYQSVRETAFCGESGASFRGLSKCNFLLSHTNTAEGGEMKIEMKCIPQSLPMVLFNVGLPVQRCAKPPPHQACPASPQINTSLLPSLLSTTHQSRKNSGSPATGGKLSSLLKTKALSGPEAVRAGMSSRATFWFDSSICPASCSKLNSILEKHLCKEGSHE